MVTTPGRYINPVQGMSSRECLETVLRANKVRDLPPTMRVMVLKGVAHNLRETADAEEKEAALSEERGNREQAAKYRNLASDDRQLAKELDAEVQDIAEHPPKVTDPIAWYQEKCKEAEKLEKKEKE